eukprot:1016710-Rhodomonas_salina.1
MQPIWIPHEGTHLDVRAVGSVEGYYHNCSAVQLQPMGYGYLDIRAVQLQPMGYGYLDIRASGTSAAYGGTHLDVSGWQRRRLQLNPMWIPVEGTGSSLPMQPMGVPVAAYQCSLWGYGYLDVGARGWQRRRHPLRRARASASSTYLRGEGGRGRGWERGR